MQYAWHVLGKCFQPKTMPKYSYFCTPHSPSLPSKGQHPSARRLQFICPLSKRTVARMSQLGVPDDVTEFFDSDEKLAAKVKQVAAILRASRNAIAFTGAGISTRWVSYGAWGLGASDVELQRSCPCYASSWVHAAPRRTLVLTSGQPEGLTTEAAHSVPYGLSQGAQGRAMDVVHGLQGTPDAAPPCSPHAPQQPHKGQLLLPPLWVPHIGLICMPFTAVRASPTSVGPRVCGP